MVRNRIKDVTLDCESCGNGYLSTRILDHLKSEHGYTYEQLTEYAEQVGIEYCSHPNGFGPNGCACGASAPTDDDDTAPQPFKLNGVTTEMHNCDATSPHAAHLWQPGKNTEWFTCSGAVNGSGVRPATPLQEEADPAPLPFRAHLAETVRGIRAARYAAGVPEGLVMVERPSGPPSVAPAGAPATHTGRPAQHADYPDQDENLSALINTFAAIDAAPPPIKEGMDFHDWWVAMADREAPTIQRKAEEYGTNSLVEMGRLYARAQGREVNDLEAIELGCFLYAYGKIQRVADALLKGKQPNVDSWHDLTIYSLMVQFSREKGTWP